MRKPPFYLILLLVVLMAFNCTCAPTEDPSGPSAPSGTDSAELPAPAEGTQADKDALSDVFEKGTAPGTMLVSVYDMTDQSEGGCYSYPLYPIPEYEEAKEASYFFEGYAISFEMKNHYDPGMDLLCRRVASPEDFSYVFANTAGLEYRALTPEEAQNLSIGIFIKLEKADGSAEYYGIGREDRIYRSPDEQEFSEVTVGPVSEIVRLHLAAEALRYAYSFGPAERVFSNSEYSGALVITDDSTVDLSGDDFEALKALLDSSEFNGTGEPQTLRFLDDYDIFPKGSIRIAVYNADSSPDPDNPSRYFVVSPEGSLYWAQRGPVGFSTTDMLQYIHLQQIPYNKLSVCDRLQRR